MPDKSYQELIVTNFGLSPSGYTGSQGTAGYVGSAGANGAGVSGPRITSIAYPGDDTAADIVGGSVITLAGANFAAGAQVVINGNAASVVSVVDSSTITFTAPPNPTGSYILYVVNADGATTIAVPGLQYSGTPAWTTAAGSLGSVAKDNNFTTTVVATGDAPVTYSVYSGALPSGFTLTANTGVITGTAPNVSVDTTYSFTIRATDAQRQDTNRAFSILVQPIVYFAATVEYLLVAGGGGGYQQAGGGGGGILSGSLAPLTLAKAAIAYPIVVGAGGPNSNKGADSTAFSLTALGGGSVSPQIGAGGAFSTNGGEGDSQRNAGGHGDWSPIANSTNSGRATNGGSGGGKAGGGGGGGGTNYNPAGSGGAGSAFSISGSSVTYAGGGGGAQSSSYQGAPGGTGGGGSGQWSSPGSGGSGGLGGGGGGSYQSSPGAGGSGVVIIRYPDSYPLATSAPGASVSTTGGYRIYQWTSSGSITI
jgi:hypothetical protein